VADAVTLLASCLSGALVGAVLAALSALTDPTAGAAFGALVCLILWIESKTE